jgi:hypothetical protein
VSAAVTAPHVYRAINAVTGALARSGVPKAHTNVQDQYQYRSIDDVLTKLAPLLARHKLCVLPRVLRRSCSERVGEDNSMLFSVHLLIAYDLVSSRDGSRHTVKAFGEAVDPSDKATAKALSSAYKSAMLQMFCIGVGNEETDGSSHRLRKAQLPTGPVQGWKAWADDIIDMIGSCETGEAIDRMRSRQARLLTSISRERPELYKLIGQAFAIRAQAIAHTSPCSPTSKGDDDAAKAKRRNVKEKVDA